MRSRRESVATGTPDRDASSGCVQRARWRNARISPPSAVVKSRGSTSEMVSAMVMVGADSILIYGKKQAKLCIITKK